jgi:hypothetical protein
MTDHDKKLLELLRELFVWTRELMPVNAANTKRQTEFGERLRNLIEGRETNGGN